MTTGVRTAARRHLVGVLIGISLILTDAEHFLCVFWPSAYLWENV